MILCWPMLDKRQRKNAAPILRDVQSMLDENEAVLERRCSQNGRVGLALLLVIDRCSSDIDVAFACLLLSLFVMFRSRILSWLLCWLTVLEPLCSWHAWRKAVSVWDCRRSCSSTLIYINDCVFWPADASTALQAAVKLYNQAFDYMPDRPDYGSAGQRAAGPGARARGSRSSRSAKCRAAKPTILWSYNAPLLCFESSGAAMALAHVDPGFSSALDFAARLSWAAFRESLAKQQRRFMVKLKYGNCVVLRTGSATRYAGQCGDMRRT